MKTYCIYHANCSDGLGAACAVLKRYRDAICIPMNYGDPLPEFEKPFRMVIVDFSFPLNICNELIDQAEEFILLDHHKTFQDAATQLLANIAVREYGDKTDMVDIVFDLNRSGALIAWQYFHDPDETPILIDYINDRDLWRFELPHSREVSLAIGLVPMELDQFSMMLKTKNIEKFKTAGEVLVARLEQEITNVINTTMRLVTIAAEDVPLINCPYYLASDALARLAKLYPFAVSYYDDGEQRVYSIRSAPGCPYDVSAIAKRYGGGGHFHAAGWRTGLYDPIFPTIPS